MEKWIELIRALVRPLVSVAVVTCLVILVMKLAFQFADLEITKLVMAEFIGIVGVIVGFWFGQRGASPPSPPSIP